MVTEIKSAKREAGLRILAKMIVRAYLGEIDRGEAGPAAYPKTEKEEDDANQRCERGYEAHPPGEDTAGDKEGDG